MILIEHIMGVSIVLWCVGLIGVLMNRHNVLLMLMSLELMFLAINTGLVGVDHLLNAISGQLMVVFTLTIAQLAHCFGHFYIDLSPFAWG